MRPNAARVYIRQLAALGIGAEAMMPTLLNAVQCVVPAEAGAFFWVDSNCEITNVCFNWQFDPELGRLYFLEFYNRRELEFGPGFSAAVRGQSGVGGIQSRFMTKRFFNSELYNVIWRPECLHHSLDCVLSDGERRVGVLQLFRPPGTRPFTARDISNLEALVPYLTHGATSKPVDESAFAGSDDADLLLADAHGRLQYASANARRLLFLATHAPLSPTSVRQDDGRLPDFLLRLCADVKAIWSGADRPPPARKRHTCWGLFFFRAHALRPLMLNGPDLIGISIERHEPVRLKLMRAVSTLPLSVRQREVCLLLAEGCSYAEVARKMGVKLSTAIDHVRKIYTRLDVHDRDELLAKLAPQPQQTGTV